MASRFLLPVSLRQATPPSRGSLPSALALLLHRDCVPEANRVAVGIDDLRAITPEYFLWCMHEAYALAEQAGAAGVDVLDLEPECRPRRRFAESALDKEDRKAFRVLQCHRTALGNLELHL